VIAFIIFGWLVSVAVASIVVTHLVMAREDMPLTLSSWGPEAVFLSSLEQESYIEYLIDSHESARDLAWLQSSLAATGPVERMNLGRQAETEPEYEDMPLAA
jgi:hypothetical protein